MKNNTGLRIGQETWRELENIHRFGYSYTTIFTDFVDVCLLSLLSLTENVQYVDVIERLNKNKLTGIYEERYMQMVGKYKENKKERKGKRPFDYFAHAWGLLHKETMQSGQDVLGEIYMTKISFGEHGQFFTPVQVSDMMAQMLYTEKTPEKQ